MSPGSPERAILAGAQAPCGGRALGATRQSNEGTDRPRDPGRTKTVVKVGHTSEIPLRCWRRKRTVHAIRRGFLRCRKSDSLFPFWKRKILLSPRT